MEQARASTGIHASKSMAELFPALPLDLARYIIQVAAHKNYRTASSLSFVSKKVQSWADPSLFHTIVLNQYLLFGFIESSPYASLISPRLIQAREYVQCTFIESFIAPQHLSNLFRWFPNTSCLDIRLNATTLNDFTRTTPLRLRKIYLRYYLERQDFGVSFFQNVTHLTVWHSFSITSGDCIAALQHLLAQLPVLHNLTHFCTNVLKRRILDVHDLMSRDRLKGVEASAKNIRVLLFSVEGWYPKSDRFWVETRESDPRIVFGVLFERCIKLDQIVRTRLHDDIPDVIIPENDRTYVRPLDIDAHWSRAECIVARRLERSL
ncbi:hypothetical protein DL96DRAFT_1615556 [Flagelloscypha sp. PMI_526]|nr:hypothetical protein DL96DRAFT_1615556 [Flagelloscypha sp. PMI_526]